VPSNEGSAQPLQSRNEPTASATQANPLRRRNTVNHFAAWARLVAGVVLVVSVIAAVFFAGFFTERDYGDVLLAVADTLVPGEDVPGEDTCIRLSCSPAGRFGQHCRQYWAPC
jgi:hypothetical protein